MKIIALANMKGGTGKSTSAYALATGLYNRGKSVLIVDADPQGNTSDTAGVNVLEVPTLCDVFDGRATVRDAIQTLKIGNLALLTAGLEMINADKRYPGFTDIFRLKQVLEDVQDYYDYCIIDTSPFPGMLTTSSLIASDFVIIPMTADRYALKGVEQMHAILANVKDPHCNPDLKIAGLLITMYNQRTILSKSIEDAIQALASNMGTKVYKSRIRRAQIIQDSQALQEDIYQSNGNAVNDYENFIDEFLKDMEG